MHPVPFLGPIRAATLIARVQTPHRFRSKRQFWAYCGLALETREQRRLSYFQEGQLVRCKKAGVHSRAELESQSRSEKSVQGRGHIGRRDCPAPFVSCFNRKPADKRNSTGHGAADVGTQNRRRRIVCLEERRTVPRRVPKATSSVIAPFQRVPCWMSSFLLKILRLRSARVRGRVSSAGFRRQSLTGHHMPLGQPNKAIGRVFRVSDRTMVGILPRACLQALFSTRQERRTEMLHPLLTDPVRETLGHQNSQPQSGAQCQ